MALENAIAEGQVSEVRVASLDRLARDLVLQETLLNRWARQGIGFRSLREPDLGTADATRVLIRQVLGAISQYERAVIASRMLAGRIARAHQGFWPGGKVPFGYQLEGDPPRVVAVPQKATIVREAGTRVLAGERVAHIAQDFERRNIPGPGGNGWEPGYLSRMLKNPTYKGEGRYRVREYVEPVTRRKSEHAMKGTLNSSRIRPEEEWITFEIPAVFSEAEWEQLQTVLATRTKPPVEAGSYLLSRRFYSACGSKYHGNYNNGKTRYLCNDRLNRKRTGKDDCGCPAIPSPVVDEAVWRTIGEIMAEPERLLTTAREELQRR
jgi:DNA invertase Pin-like site-specific DNA recombinase